MIKESQISAFTQFSAKFTSCWYEISKNNKRQRQNNEVLFKYTRIITLRMCMKYYDPFIYQGQLLLELPKSSSIAYTLEQRQA